MMIRTGLLLIVTIVLGIPAVTSTGLSRELEDLPTPAPASVVLDHNHVGHAACCQDLCGHCSPAAHHKYRLTARRMLKCQGAVEVCMHVVNPSCCGCPVEIPMCIPACCIDEAPTVRNDCGLFGRGVVHLDWACCGYSAKVIFKHSGHIDVIYTAH